MQQAGEYGQPLVRATELRVPVVAGFTTLRLRTANVGFSGTIVGSTAPDNAAFVTLKNEGPAVTVQLVESTDYANNPFSNVGPAFALAAQGQASATVYPKASYLELRGLTGTGAVTLKLNSQMRFDLLAFDKFDATYPQASQTQQYPSWNSL